VLHSCTIHFSLLHTSVQLLLTMGNRHVILRVIGHGMEGVRRNNLVGIARGSWSSHSRGQLRGMVVVIATILSQSSSMGGRLVGGLARGVGVDGALGMLVHL